MLTKLKYSSNVEDRRTEKKTVSINNIYSDKAQRFIHDTENVKTCMKNLSV